MKPGALLLNLSRGHVVDVGERSGPRPAPLDFGPLAAATRALFDFDFSGRIATLSCPALVTVGTEDRLCSTSAAEEVARLIPGAGFQVLAGSGHMIMLEQPAAICVMHRARRGPDAQRLAGEEGTLQHQTAAGSEGGTQAHAEIA